MLLDYTRLEKSKLENIDRQFKPALEKVRETFNQAQDEFDKLDKDAENKNEIDAKLKKARGEYFAALNAYETKRAPITSNAEKRELKYFATHTDKLAQMLQSEIEFQILSLALLGDFDSRTVFQTEIKEQLTATLKRYFDFLKEHDNEKYKLVIDFMENAIADKAEIMSTHKEQLKEMLKELAQKLFKDKKSLNTWNKVYGHMLQNNIINDFQRIARLDNGHGLLDTWNKQGTFIQGNIKLFMPHYDTLFKKTITKEKEKGKGVRKEKESGEINTPAKKILDIATLIFTNNGHDPAIRFTLDEYMELCGLSSETETRKQVNSALDMLFDIQISYSDGKNKGNNYLDMRIIDAKGIKNSIVYLHFAPLYVEMLEKVAKHSVMPYQLDILKASKGSKNRNAFDIARKILEHRYMNAGKVNERKISIRTLLESAQFLPTEKQVRAGNRNFTDRIVKPFMADFESACSYLGIGEKGYELHYSNKEKIPDSELKNLKYETFINAHVWFNELPEYPNQDARLERKKEHEQKALAEQNEKLKEKDNE